jgi:D-apionolactonase
MTTDNIYYFGEDHAAPPTVTLQAGPVRLIYDNGCLRYLKAGQDEILRMIYFAVRDHNWDTIEGEIRNERIKKGDQEFFISFTSHHKKGPVDMNFQCEIIGEKTGSIGFRIEGKAASSFKKNRIGFCVLHPVMQNIGKPCWIDHGNGVVSEKKFPEWISPHQPFSDIASMEWMVRESVRARIEFEGDVFETEDQRNWTDASYKTYCTPLGIPFPVTIEAGETVQQKIQLGLTGLDAGTTAEDEDRVLVFSLDEELGFSLPGLGMGSSSSYERLDLQTVNLIRKLTPDHIRWDIDVLSEDLSDKLRLIRVELTALDTKACLALFFSKDPEGEYLRFLEEASRWKDRIKYLILFSKNDKTTPDTLTNLLAARIREDFPGVRIGGGTNAYFAELNRERIEQKNLDFIVYSVNPQVHAFDHASLTETLEGQFHTVKSARLFSPGKEIMISPVTFKPRFNPNATGSEIPLIPGELPPQVDVRQMSLYGACWTLGSIKFLTEAGVNHITYFETAGWRGLVQGPEDPPDSQNFRAVKGDVFPIFMVFSWLKGLGEVSVIRTSSSEPLIFDGLAVEKGSTIHVFLANFSTWEQPMIIEGLTGPYIQRTLSGENVREFVHESEGENIIPGVEVADILLPPVSISWITSKSE